VHYGWVVVAATFLTMLVTAGAVGAPGVLLLPLQREFGWSTAAISSAMAVRLLLFGLMGPFAAAFINRYGVRKVTLTALGLIASGLSRTVLATYLPAFFRGGRPVSARRGTGPDAWTARRRRGRGHGKYSDRPLADIARGLSIQHTATAKFSAIFSGEACRRW
jgi:MFS family permease